MQMSVEMTTAAHRKVTTPKRAMVVATPTVRRERQRAAIEERRQTRAIDPELSSLIASHPTDEEAIDIEPTSSEPTMDPDFVVPYYMGKIDACVRKKKSDNEPFQITTCVLGAAQRKQLHHHCNKYHLQSSSSGPEGERRITILSEWRFAPDKPMAPSVGDGAIGFLVARTKDGSAGVLRGKVTAHVIVGGTANWTLVYHGGFEETVTIDTLNLRLQDRYILLVHP